MFSYRAGHRQRGRRSADRQRRGSCRSAADTTSARAQKLWFTPFANLIVSSSGNLTSGNTVVTDASYSMLQLGAGLTWR